MNPCNQDTSVSKQNQYSYITYLRPTQLSRSLATASLDVFDQIVPYMTDDQYDYCLVTLRNDAAKKLKDAWTKVYLH